MTLKLLHIIGVVYGDWHTRLFEKTGVPNLAGLLPEIPDQLAQKTRLRIFTTENDRERIVNALDRNQIGKSVSYEVLPLVLPPKAGAPYPEMNRMHQIALREAEKEDAGLFFIFPDQILSEGTFRAILRTVEKGIRLVMYPSIRVKLEPVLPLLEQLIDGEPHHVLRAEPRKLVRMVMPHFHRLLTDFYWESYAKPTVCASHYGVFWKVGDKGILARCLHNYVAFAWPVVKGADYRYTIDIHFIKKAFPDIRQVGVIDDSDEMFAFDLSESNRDYQVTVWAACRAHRFFKVIQNRDIFTDYHLKTALVLCRIHGDDLDEEWRGAEWQFDRATSPVFMLALLLRMAGGNWKRCRRKTGEIVVRLWKGLFFDIWKTRIWKPMKDGLVYTIFNIAWLTVRAVLEITRFRVEKKHQVWHSSESKPDKVRTDRIVL